MAKKIRVKRRETAPTPPPVAKPEELTEWQIATGVVSVGEVVKVNHHSFGGRWHELTLKRITMMNERVYFHFYSSPPGSITVGEDSVRAIKKKIRINKEK